jgi:hypothetical protein
MPARFAAAFTTCQIALGVIRSPQIFPTRLTRRKMTPSTPAAQSTHRRRISPTLEPEPYGCVSLCQSGRRSPSAPRGPRNLPFRARLARPVVGRIQGAEPESPDHVCFGDCLRMILEARSGTDRQSAGCQSELRTPRRFSPLTRRIPAASSGLRRPLSEAS